MHKYHTYLYKIIRISRRWVGLLLEYINKVDDSKEMMSSRHKAEENENYKLPE